MRAIVIEKFGGPDSLVYKDLPEPEPLTGQVVIEVKAFGINHAEMHMRRGEWAEAAKVSGTECVGLVKAAPRRRVPIRCQGCGADGRPRTHHQRQLRRIHPGTGIERCAHRVRSALGRACCDPRDIFDLLNVPLLAFGDRSPSPTSSTLC